MERPPGARNKKGTRETERGFYKRGWRRNRDRHKWYYKIIKV